MIHNGTIELVGDVEADDEAVSLPASALRVARVRELERDNEVIRARGLPRDTAPQPRADATVKPAPAVVKQGIATKSTREPSVGQEPEPRASRRGNGAGYGHSARRLAKDRGG